MYNISLQGNIQRSQLVIEQLGETKKTTVKVGFLVGRKVRKLRCFQLPKQFRMSLRYLMVQQVCLL